MGIAKEIKGTKGIVAHILSVLPASRGDDTMLYLEVCRAMNPMVMGLTFEMVLTHRKSLTIPKFESVRRARQLVQAQNPELKPSEEVIDAKFEEWKAVRKLVTE